MFETAGTAGDNGKLVLSTKYLVSKGPSLRAASHDKYDSRVLQPPSVSFFLRTTYYSKSIRSPERMRLTPSQVCYGQETTASVCWKGTTTRLHARTLFSKHGVDVFPPWNGRAFTTTSKKVTGKIKCTIVLAVQMM